MPTSDRDRFDEVPRTGGRVGAHRAENPGMNGWVVLLWSAVAVLVLVAGGIFGVMVAMGKISLGGPQPSPSASAPAPTTSAAGTLDTSYGVMVLNATTAEDFASTTRDTIIAAGWPATSVLAGDADAQDFAETTVYYQAASDESAARALADLIGGARVQQSDAYANDVAEGQKQLTVVLGLDTAPAMSSLPESTPAGDSTGEESGDFAE